MELYINTFATFKEGEGYYEAEIRGTEYLMREYLIKYQEYTMHTFERRITTILFIFKLCLMHLCLVSK